MPNTGPDDIFEDYSNQPAPSPDAAVPENKEQYFEKFVFNFDAENINARELLAIRALLDWVVYTHKISMDRIEQQVAAHFGVTNLNRLARADYMRVVAYLVSFHVPTPNDVDE